MATKTILNMPTPAAAAQATSAPAKTDTRPRGDAREYVTTSIRFKKAVMQRLKKAAIDRDQSLQGMVEQALDALLRAETGKSIPGLWSGK